MTVVASPVADRTITSRSLSQFVLIPSSILVYLWPAMSRSWRSISLWRAALVAAFNVLAGCGWFYLMLVASAVWTNRPEIEKRMGSVWQIRSLREGSLYLRADFLSGWRSWSGVDRGSMFALMAFFLLAAFLLPFFVILPFGARPGPNRPCLRHVARTVLLGSGAVHLWGAAYTMLLLAFASIHLPTLADDYCRGITPLLLAFVVLSLWTLAVLMMAVRQDYRTPTDFPQPHDPWCDDCGYMLTGIDPAGRCPECGRLIADSLGPQSRPPTPWEREPRFGNWRVVAAQVHAIVRRPRAFFFSMPTLSGQSAAQKWLLASALVIFIAALPIVPALYLLLDAEWSFAAIAGALAMSLSWAVFGMMMVGVETAGIATFSRMRRQTVYLSTSAKVTAYSAVLMIPWVLLGGAQLVAYVYLSSHQAFERIFHLGMRGEQVALALSLAVAHIGGLLWYEITVYRGIRAIQYANK